MEITTKLLRMHYHLKSLVPFLSEHFPDGCDHVELLEKLDELKDYRRSWLIRKLKLSAIDTHWDKNGLISSEMTYIDGHQNGVYRAFFESGNIKIDSSMSSDHEKHGLHRVWDDNGQLVTESNYVKGEKHGLDRSWFPNGFPCYECNYVYGSRDGVELKWLENGKLYRTNSFFKGKHVRRLPEGYPMNKKENNDVFDYQAIAPIDMPLYDRRRISVGDIFCNQAKCNLCGDIIRSKGMNHEQYCLCGKSCVDGGSFYKIRLCAPMTDMSIHYNDLPTKNDIAVNRPIYIKNG
ncbi:MORN variant [uncultured Caudovirales phage]|uniref:MORN variant n=1 Tax=uncultured Caudovirales phage TaxID=2100421 RepID=A0A6J5Q9G2_9CAUD|nr:MORN variant [uncultured Caudovirales phage]